MDPEEGVEDPKVEEVEVFKVELVDPKVMEVFKAVVEDPRFLNLTINDLASLMMRATRLN